MKVIIIGSGMSGLTAGAYLAKKGYEVLVYEQFSSIGGVTATIEKDGFKWDLGPLIIEGLGNNEAAGMILDDLGLRDRITLVRDDRTYSFPDFTIEKPDEFKGNFWRRDRLKELFPDQAKDIDKYYKFYVRVMGIVSAHFKSERSQGFASFINKIRMIMKLLPVITRINWSAEKMMNHFFSDEKLIAVFTSILADLVVKPSDFPGFGIPVLNPEPAFDKRVDTRISKHVNQNSFHNIKGGCQSMVDAFAGFIRENGGIIKTNSTVSRIIVEDGTAKGVIVNNDELETSDLVIASGGINESIINLIGKENLPDEFIEKLNQVPLMESIFMVHLGIDFDPAKHQKSNLVYYYGTYDIEDGVEKIQNGIYHEGKDGFLIYIPSKNSPEMAPAGCHAVTIYTIAPNKLDKGTWESRKDEMADKLIMEAEKHIPGLRQNANTMVILTPDDFKKRTHLIHHAFGGITPVVGKSGAPHKTAVKNLWFVGSQSESAGGVSNVMVGAWRTTNCILKENDL